MKKTVQLAIAAVVSPGAFWLADLYVARYEGWGQWAAAPILLLPLGYGLAVILYGLGISYQAIRKSEPAGVVLLLTLTAASPLIYTYIR